MHDPNVPEGRDPQLWYIAHKRASFKRHLASYLAVNIFLWLLWAFTSSTPEGNVPWPIWPTIGWGIGLASHFISAYLSSGISQTEKEYEKLKQNNL